MLTNPSFYVFGDTFRVLHFYFYFTLLQNLDESTNTELKSCARYIFASLILGLKENFCETRKNIFYFTSKALFFLEKIKV